MASQVQSTTRADKARALIEAGHVQLFPGHPFALVRSAGDPTRYYEVTRDRCDCRDFARGNECQHRLAVRELCHLYRRLRLEAQEHGRVRVPAELLLALDAYTILAGATRTAT